MLITFVKSLTQLEDLPTSPRPQVALVGRSNVGKSSLLNHLAGQKGLAYVSAEPGRTQTINVFDIEGRAYLVDLPGYGFAKTSKAKREAFSGMVREYLWQARALKHVFLIIDARLGFTDLDRDMFGYLLSGQIPTTVIVNKIDKLSHSESINIMYKLESEYPQANFIAHSNVSGKGRGEIWQILEQTARAAI